MDGRQVSWRQEAVYVQQVHSSMISMYGRTRVQQYMNTATVQQSINTAAVQQSIDTATVQQYINTASPL
jgi:hypothetical protein